jgi:DNA-binding beta-propeller fold protein YncE
MLLVSTRTQFAMFSQDPVSNGAASGVLERNYRVSDSSSGAGSFAPYSEPFTLTGGGGPRSIEFYAQDRVENRETVKSLSVVLDADGPRIDLITPSPDHEGICRVLNGTVSVTGAVIDPNLKDWRLEAALGQNAATGYVLIASGTVSFSPGVLAVWSTRDMEGYRTLRLSAQDRVDNRSEIALNVFVGEPRRKLVLGGGDMFNNPSGVAVGPRDPASGPESYIYVADTNNDRIAVFTATGALVSVFGEEDREDVGREHGERREDDKKYRPLRFNKPRDVEVDGFGNMFVADTENHRVLKLSSTGQVLLSLGRQKEHSRSESYPGRENGQFRRPAGVAIGPGGTASRPAGNIYVSDTGNRRVQVFDSSGTFLMSLPIPEPDDEDRDDDSDEDLLRPEGIAVDALGNIYVADSKGRRALRFTPDGTLTLAIGSRPRGYSGRSRYHDRDDRGNFREKGIFQRPEGIAVSQDGSCILVSDSKQDRIFAFDAEGRATLAFGKQGEIKDKKPLPAELVLHKPMGLALDAQGNLFVADRNNDRIQKFGYPDGGPTLIVSGIRGEDDDDGGRRSSARAASADSASVEPAAVSADPSFTLRDVYVFPNPAVAGAKPVIHVAVGIADSLTIRIYNIAGQQVHETTLDRTPAIIDDGSGPKYAYEYAWEGHIPSGVYLYSIEAKKNGYSSIRKAGRFGVVR